MKWYKCVGVVVVWVTVVGLVRAADPVPSVGKVVPSEPAKAKPLYRSALVAAAGDKSLPWYYPKPGEFPPPDTARLITARLIRSDALNRTGRIAPDTVGGQVEYLNMFPDIEVLPYARLTRHGAAAEFRDFPQDAHLYILGYRVEGDKSKPYQVLVAEDDFSHFQRQRKVYHIEEVRPGEGRIKVSIRGGDSAAPEVDILVQDSFPSPTVFDDPKQRPYDLAIEADTRVWKGHGVGSLSDLKVGQDVLINLAGCTPYRDGTMQAHCTEIWVDEESRTLATEFQRGKYLAWTRKRGLPGWVEHTHGKDVTITLFWPIELFAGKDGVRESEVIPGKEVRVAVAEYSLRTYGQGFDAMASKVVDVKTIPVETGSGGVRLVVQPKLLLEGYRPGKIVRVFPASWPVWQLPPGEGYHPLMSP